MPTLSELVKFKNDLLELIEQLPLDHNINEKIELFNGLKSRNETLDYTQLIQSHIDNYQDLIVKNNSIVETVKKSIDIIDIDINQLIVNTVDRNKFNEENMSFHLASTDEIEFIVKSRIGVHGDWHFPGLQICRYAVEERFPQSELQLFASAKTRLDSMIACDPLYIVNNNIKSLENIIETYPEAYQRRLRLYEINDRNFNILPQAQFGIVLCWDYFNYLQIDFIEIYLREIIKLLKPGGKLLFSYNNCEVVSSSRLVEEGKSSWTTTTLLQNLITAIGYEFVVAENFPTNDIFDSYVSWIEVKKPGELTTVKRTQSVGTLLSK